MMGKLYLVPTPIGNLKDITFRAVEVLKEVDLILAEDTRTSGKLLKHFEIFTHMQSHHMHNEHKTVDNVVRRIINGETIYNAIKIGLVCSSYSLKQVGAITDLPNISKIKKEFNI